MNTYTPTYAQRAALAYAAAEAATDPRDKATFRAAAQTWERLAKPTTQPAFSLQPYVRQLEALKQDVAVPANAPAPDAASVGKPQVTRIVATARQTIGQSVTIEF